MRDFYSFLILSCFVKGVFLVFWVSPFAALFFVGEKKSPFFIGDLFFALFSLLFTKPTLSPLSAGSPQIWLLDNFLGQVLFFFCLVSEPGRSEPGALLLFYLVTEPGWCGPGTFFFLCVLGVCAGTNDQVY